MSDAPARTSTTTSLADLERTLERLHAEYRARLAEATNEQALRKAFADYGGAQGAIRVAQKEALRTAPNAEKKAIGQLTNRVIADIEAALDARLAELAAEARARDLARTVDVTLPGRARRLGHLHAITLCRREIEEALAQLGFTVAEGPEVESDFHNFEALGMPPDHPARDMADTFYLEGGGLLLRTHTSPVQIRTMLGQKPPVRIIAPGPVFRKDDDPTHSPMFNQIEGLCVDRGITFADLKGTLLFFVRRLFGERHGVRLRPSYFPFVEPGAEVDMSCVFCGGPDSPGRATCRTCKQTGWIEIGGAGMVDPVVFSSVGYDPDEVSGFAFGMGIDRIAMLRYGVDDLKLFFDGDVRFASQFRSVS
jgi:phenylalanyl-tRNA synthetase alpha chain